MHLKCNIKGEYSHPKYIGLKDFILDLETDELLPYNPRFIIQNKINYNYNEDAYHKLLDNTLNKVVCHDKNLRLLLEEMIGYTLYRANTMQKAFILTGSGANGKSTILNLIKQLLGEENYTAMSIQELEGTFEPAELHNKLANIGDDISARYLEKSSNFKKAVTGETFLVQQKFGHPFVLENYSTQIFCANELPPVSDRSDGFARRLIIIPFNAKFTPDDPDYDPFIEDKLLSEDAMEYLLKLAIGGLKRVLYNREFTSSQASEIERAKYLKENNSVLQWLDDNPKIINEPTGQVYQDYTLWTQLSGFRPLNRVNFGKELAKLGYESKPIYADGKTIRVYVKEE
jgi:putative DNA primase/helicase